LLVNLPIPHLGAPTRPSTLDVLRAKEHAPIPSPSIVFTFVLTFEYIKEPGGASLVVILLMIIIGYSINGY
jgi:hypothetical protein